MLEYLGKYKELRIKPIKIKESFKSRTKAIQMYVAKNRRSILPLLSEVSKKLKDMQLGIIRIIHYSIIAIELT